jgi:hypothetical protein
MLLNITQYFVIISGGYVTLALIANVGYFRVVGFQYADLFSFQDIFQVNIFIARNIISLMIIYGLYCLLVPFLKWAADKLKVAFIFQFLVRFFKSGLDDNTWLGHLFLIWLILLSILIRGLASNLGFFIEFAAFVSLPLLIIWWLWTLWRGGGVREEIVLFFVVFQIVWVFYNMGELWAKYDLRDSTRIVSVQYVNGGCIDRIFLRGNDRGYLFFDSYSGGVSFERRERIDRIGMKGACI